MTDPRPRTVALHQYAGFGDLIWHLPYFRLLAERSQAGRLSVIAKPSSMARAILSVEPWADTVIEYDRRPRASESRTGRHAGLAGMRQMAADLRAGGFERIVLFSHNPSRGLLAWLAGIPRRAGYGSTAIQRLFLNEPPYIRKYVGPSVSVYKDVSAYAVALGLCSAPIVPKMIVPPDLIEAMRSRFAHLPRPLHAFAIGSSEPFKQWGAERFAALAEALIERGGSVLLVGGPNEEPIAKRIEALVPAARRPALARLTDAPILGSAAALSIADAEIGNDTGVSNMAAACNVPAHVLLGPRPLLDHDPLMHMIRAPRLSDITVADVLQSLALAAGGAG